MNLKKKAGLALALAAIFTTGGAGPGLADYVTNIDPGGAIDGNISMLDTTAVIDRHRCGAAKLPG